MSFKKQLAKLKSDIEAIKSQLLEADAAIKALPNGPQKSALKRAIQPVWDQWFEPKAAPKPRRATWDFGKWQAEAIHQTALAKTLKDAGRLDLARVAQKRAGEAEKQAKRLR